VAAPVKNAEGFSKEVYWESAQPVALSGSTGASATEVQGTSADGSPAVGKPVRVAGKDDAGNVQDLHTDTAGDVQIDVLTLPALTAGESHIGEVGGNSDIISPTVTVSTSPAYTSGDVVGGKLTLTGAVRTAGKAVVLQNISIKDNANQKPVGNILIFDSDPAAATTTDNAAFAYSTDFGKQIARIPVVAADWDTINGKASATLPNLGRVLKAASGTTLYAVFVATSTPTFAATTDVTITFGLLRD
jgi:hypothetical protein